ncbi:MAG: ankyrin repeat domain-containing protein [Pseudomonadota bacterium]
MAIDFNKRTRIMAGVLVLALGGAGAAAWFLYFDEPPPPRRAAPAVVKAAPKPASDAAKSAPADAAKPAVDAPHWADAAKPAAEAPKQADAAKPGAAAPAPKPGAKPIPTNPDKLIAEVIETAGVKTYYQNFAREAMLKSSASGQEQRQAADPADFAAATAIVEREFEPGKLAAELAANLKGANLDAERLARFLELLRQPIALKMTSREMRNVTPEAMKEYADNLRKGQPPAARVKLIQSLDELTRTSEVGTDMASAMARDMIDTMLDAMKRAGKSVQREARQTVGTQVNAIRIQARPQIRAVMYVMYRNATDEELSEYVKLLDTDTGRWGLDLLAEGMRRALVSRGSALGRENARFAVAKQGAPAKAAAAPQLSARTEEEKPAVKPAATPEAAAPVEAPGYRRPANIREIYTRYNDLVSATVLRDSTAVKELLDDGKNPNIRQSDGLTPLMIAASNGDTDIAAMLLAKGADPNLRAGGRSALSIARARGGAGVVQLLERSGARD